MWHVPVQTVQVERTLNLPTQMEHPERSSTCVTTPTAPRCMAQLPIFVHISRGTIVKGHISASTVINVLPGPMSCIDTYESTQVRSGLSAQSVANVLCVVTTSTGILRLTRTRRPAATAVWKSHPLNPISPNSARLMQTLQTPCEGLIDELFGVESSTTVTIAPNPHNDVMLLTQLLSSVIQVD